MFTFRHTFAAHLARKGIPLACIQVLLGHNGPHQTQLYARIYIMKQEKNCMIRLCKITE
ncbi:tyrosine-type recombinase/integrase [Cytobacillus oceanisediminis]|uniref:tyrosine-type recombinase/integrase n=1 Tax=Cytobacillus oceanisediminis TaxID=665099 RepID=UPI0035BBA724